VIFPSSNILGIALADRTITCAELSGRAGRGGKQVVRKTATLTLAPDETIEKPEAMGRALATFLREKGFSASKVVVGVPAKWVIAVEKEIPPANSQQVRAMLRLQAERMSVGESGGDMVYDFAGDDNTGKAGKVLLVAMMRRQLDRITKAMETAKLAVDAVTPMSLALASAARNGEASAGKPLLVLARHGAEVVMQNAHGGSPRMLRHISVSVTNGHGAPAMAPLGLELRRTVAMSPPTNGTGPASEPELLLFDSIGLSDEQLSELSDRIGVKVRGDDDLSGLGVQTQPQALATTEPDGPVGRFAPAIALALVGTRHELLPLNFLDTRLAPPAAKKFGRGTVWAAGIAAAIVIGIVALWVHVVLLQRHLDSVDQSKKEIAQPLAVAQAVKDRVDFSNGYFKTRTPMLEDMREIWASFRDDEPIWATTLSLNEDRDPKTQPAGRVLGRLEGKTTDMRIANGVADRLRANPHFSNVSGPDLTGAGGRQRDQSSFSITFSYSPEKPAPATKQTKK
jgi:hypothetical protein